MRRLRTDGGDPADSDTDGDPVDGDPADDPADGDRAEDAPAQDATVEADAEDATGEADIEEAPEGADVEDAPDEADGENAPDAADRTGSRAGEGGVDRSNVEVRAAGEAEPADPKWEKPDPEDIPEFEIRADHPAAGGGAGAGGSEGERAGSPPGGSEDVDPTAGMPNDAAAPGTRIREEGTEGYVAALELCARLPEDVRLPPEAADLVPVAVEAELEQDVQSFAAAEFDNPTPHVEALSFEEADGDVWLRIRLGVPPEAFADLDPDAIRAHALQELDGVF